MQIPMPTPSLFRVPAASLSRFAVHRISSSRSRLAQRLSGRVSVEPTLLEKRLADAFDLFDSAKSGEVDVIELGALIRTLGCVITQAELQEIQLEIEDVNTNCVPKRKFVEYMNKAINERKYTPTQPEDLLKAFQLLDPENRGYIMKNELTKILMETGEPFNEKEMADMMILACDPETKQIDYESYINLLMVNVPESMNVYSILDRMEREKLEAMPKKRRLESLLMQFDTPK